MSNSTIKDTLKSIKREHIFLAMEKLDNEKIPNSRQSFAYNVVNPTNQNTYPPPYLLETAYNIATNKEIRHGFFNRIGKNSDHFKFLKEKGFNIIEKGDKMFNEMNKTKYFLKRIKKQDTKGEFFIPNKFLGKDNFFLSPEEEDTAPTGDHPHIIDLTFKWHNVNADLEVNPLKKYRMEIHKNSDTRLAKTPKLELVGRPLLIIKKNNSKEYEAWIYKKGDKNYDIADKILGNKGYVLTEKIIEDRQRMNHPLNQILYGPPGTGKTFSTITKALDIIGVEYESYEKAQELFQNELGKRIEFVTMHQSFSYEDFVQGFKPLNPEEGEGITFKNKNGVFKDICERADENRFLDKRNTQENEILIDKLFPSFYLSIDENSVYEILKEKVYEGKNVPQYLAIEYFNKKLGKKYCKAWRDKFDYILGDKSPRVGYQPDKFREGELEDFTKYSEKFEKLTSDERKKKLISEWIDDKPQTSTNSSELNNHVIILDEINRANISRVFGELIALIEKDKRDGKLKATLPSGESFTVPSNLYIIGTMNTADKSIALVDIALRRRFEFTALYPDTEILKNVLEENNFNADDVIQRVNMLTRLNRIIRSKKSVDFEIGHSYFMEDDDLINILNKQVLPLLNEYFMYDLRKVKDIIEKTQKDREGRAIPKPGIVFSKKVWEDRGLLKVESINLTEEHTEQVETEETPVEA